jgi:flagellar L-ring protein precursor FlgH
MAYVKPKLILLMCSMLLMILGTSASGESLYDPSGANLFADLKAQTIGDILFILVEENTTSTSEAKTDGSKGINMQGGAKVTGFFETLLGLPEVIEPLESLNVNPQEEFKASGATSTKGTFKSRITATVIDILPNGNMVIEGKRTIKINDDTESMVIIGTIRPWDIGADNTIRSQMIADVEISYTGRGQIAERQKAGLLTKLFNFIF